ncbi:Protein of unknown function [Gryllus bimaculatus]|nr:Protein of unknown function [Gryllus bimaculatus]
MTQRHFAVRKTCDCGAPTSTASSSLSSLAAADPFRQYVASENTPGRRKDALEQNHATYANV